MKSTSVRLDDSMMQAVQRECELLGTNASDFVRQAIALRLGALSAARAIAAGVKPNELADHDELMRALAEVEKRGRR